MKRHCGFLRPVDLLPSGPVWAQGDLHLDECPKPYMTAESLGMLENYLVWKRFGGQPVEMRSAKEVDGFLVLDAEIAAEERAYASQNRRAN
jgi:hypothetical protein